MPLANSCWPSLSFRNEVPRAMDGPEMAPINGLISEPASRFSKITGAVVEAILRAPSRAAARRPASVPRLLGGRQVGFPARRAAVIAGLHPVLVAGDGRGADGEGGRAVNAGEPAAGDERPLGRRPRAAAAVGVGHLGHGAGGGLGDAGAVLQRLGGRFGGIVEVQVAQGAAGQMLGVGQAGVGVLRRQPRHGDRAFHKLGAGLGRDVGPRHRGLPAAHEDPQAQVAGFLALHLFQRARAHRDRKASALGAHGFGRRPRRPSAPRPPRRSAGSHSWGGYGGPRARSQACPAPQASSIEPRKTRKTRKVERTRRSPPYARHPTVARSAIRGTQADGVAADGPDGSPGSACG